MLSQKKIFSKNSSQAIVVGNTAYLSGVLGMNKDTLKVVEGGIAAETKVALENLKNILEAAGSKIENVIKCTVLLNDINDFGTVNEEYKKSKLNEIELFL